MIQDVVSSLGFEIVALLLTTAIGLAIALGRARVLLQFQERHGARLANDLRDEKSRTASMDAIINDQQERLGQQAQLLGRFRRVAIAEGWNDDKLKTTVFRPGVTLPEQKYPTVRFERPSSDPPFDPPGFEPPSSDPPELPSLPPPVPRRRRGGGN